MNREEGCFVCGRWMPLRMLSLGKRESCSEVVRRRTLVCSLYDVYLCRYCKATCARCKCVIPKAQANLEVSDGCCSGCMVESVKDNRKRKKK